MGTRNVQRFIDASAVPFIVPIPFSGLTAVASPLTVQSAVISTTEDFYGFTIGSRGTGAFQFKLTDGSGVLVTLDFIDGLDQAGNERFINLGVAGRLVPFFSPKDSKITIVLTTLLAGPLTGLIEIMGDKIKG